MSIIIICVFIVLFIINLNLKDKLVKSMICFYILWWGSNLIISTFNPYGLYGLSLHTYILLVLNVLSFVMGFSLMKNNSGVQKIDLRSLELQFNQILYNRRVLLIMLLFTIYIVFKLYKYVTIFPFLNEENLRMVKYEVGLLFSSGIEIIFFNYFIETTSFFAGIFISYCLITKRYNSAIFYLSIVFYLSYSLIGAGRGPIIMLLFYIVFFSIIRKRLRVKNRYKRKRFLLYLFFTLGYITMAFQTSVRYGNYSFSFDSFFYGSNILLKHFTIYCTGSFRALEYGINNFSSLQYSFGKYSFLGIEDMFFYFSKIIGIDYHPFSYSLGATLTESFMIGNNQTFNALFTSVFPFYTDFGILGIIVMSFLFGFFYKLVIVDFIQTNNVYTFMCVLFLSVCAVYSLFTWKFTSASSFIILFILYIKRKNVSF